MTNIRFAQLQHPVGQGGFHTGWLYQPTGPAGPAGIGPGNVRFAWIYDCGSDQLSVLNDELRRVRGASFNVMFLSHLDGDHVSGVDKLLLAAAGVTEVVLPYLGDDDWALHLAAAAADGRLSGTLIDLAEDPAGWFGTRGVSQVTYVEGADGDDDDPLGPDPTDPELPDPDGAADFRKVEPDDDVLTVSWTRQPRQLAPGNAGGSRAATVLLPKGAVATISGGTGKLNWLLSPFAFKPSPRRMSQFSVMLANTLGPGLTAAQYAAAARTKTGRAKLQICYDVVFAGHNLHSMALYAGPSRPHGKLGTKVWQGAMVRRMSEPGWLSTGDVDLQVTKRRQGLIRFYSGYATMIGQLSLPHHGSDNSFDTGILTALPNLSFAIAAVGANGHGHPGQFVQREVTARASRSFVRVDESPSSFFRVTGPVGR